MGSSLGMKFLVLVAVLAAVNAWDADEIFASRNEVAALKCKNGKGNLAGGQEVTIETPNYPKNYPNKAKCNWKIKVPAKEVVHIWCENFDVRKGDFLRVVRESSKIFGSFAAGFGETLPASTAAPEPGCGSCCTECTSQILTQCSSTFSSGPPFYSTVHTMPNTILDTDPTAFVSVSTASDGIVDFMWGPDGWSRKVPAWQFTAKFKDQDQDTVISFDKDVGDATFCAPHA